MSIRRKLLILLVITSALPLVIFTVFSLNNSIQTAKATAMSENLNRSAIVQEKIANLLATNFHGIKFLSTNPLVRSYAPENKPFLANAAKTYTDLRAINLADSTGMQVVRSDDKLKSNVADRSYFKACMAGQAENVSEILVGKSDGRLVSILAVPITDTASGKVTGIIEGTIELSVLNDFAKKSSTDNMTVFILDRNGKLLAHPISNPQVPGERADFTNYDFVKQGLAGTSGSAEVTMAGTKMLVSYMRNETSGWLICTAIPYQTAIANSISNAVKLLLIGLLLILISSATAFPLANTATKPILALATAANAVAGGNLTGKKLDIRSRDEVGLLASAFTTMTDNLTLLIRKIQKNAEVVAASSKQLTANSEQSAQAAVQVATSIAEVSVGAEKQHSLVESTFEIAARISENISLVASKANAVSAQSTKTATMAKEGEQSLQTAISHMAELEATVDTSARVVTRLGQRSKEIGEIINTISNIASQTNLLALNAAIEAARAGHQGRGFAVVADEVRKLAVQSQAAAKQIEELISGIRCETDKAVQAMDHGSTKVKLGTGVVKEAGAAFQNIVDMTVELSEQVSEISAAIQNADSGSRQIVSSVNDITTLTRTTTSESQTVSVATEEQSASMQEIILSTKNLASMALELKEAISKFHT